MKKILLVLVVVLLCGCTANYDLKIDANNNYYETLTLIEESSDNADKSYLHTLYLEEYPIYNSEEFMYYKPNEKIEGNTYYNKNLYVENNLYKSEYTATFNNDSYLDSRILVTSFKERNVGYNAKGKYYYLELSNLIIYNAQNNINKVNVSIEIDSNYVVLYNNATSVNNNVYTWNFDSSNADLKIRYQTLENYEESKKNNSSNINNNNQNINNTNNNQNSRESSVKDLIIIICLLLCFVICLIVVLIISKKVRK